MVTIQISLINILINLNKYTAQFTYTFKTHFHILIQLKTDRNTEYVSFETIMTLDKKHTYTLEFFLLLSLFLGRTLYCIH